jgi:hypothetical protein
MRSIVGKIDPRGVFIDATIMATPQHVSVLKARSLPIPQPLLRARWWTRARPRASLTSASSGSSDSSRPEKRWSIPQPPARNTRRERAVRRELLPDRSRHRVRGPVQRQRDRVGPSQRRVRRDHWMGHPLEVRADVQRACKSIPARFLVRHRKSTIHTARFSMSSVWIHGWLVGESSVLRLGGTSCDRCGSARCCS